MGNVNVTSRGIDHSGYTKVAAPSFRAETRITFTPAVRFSREISDRRLRDLVPLRSEMQLAHHRRRSVPVAVLAPLAIGLMLIACNSSSSPAPTQNTSPATPLSVTEV